MLDDDDDWKQMETENQTTLESSGLRGPHSQCPVVLVGRIWRFWECLELRVSSRTQVANITEPLSISATCTGKEHRVVFDTRGSFAGHQHNFARTNTLSNTCANVPRCAGKKRSGV